MPAPTNKRDQPNPAKKESEPTPAPSARQRRSPGYTARPHRVACEKAFLRHKARSQDPTWTDDEVEGEVERKFAEMMPSDPRERKQYEETALVSYCPDREEIRQLVEVAAMRRLPVAQELEAQLRDCEDGRPSDRVLASTVFTRNIWENGRPEVWCHVQQLHSDYRLLHWAYDWPVAHSAGQHFTNIYKTMKAALDRHPDETLVVLNIRALRQLREHIGCEDIGRYILIDGTDIPAPREQRQHDADFPGEEAFLRRGLNDADFAYHGNKGLTRKSWRGPRLIVLVDLLTGLPIAWIVKPGSRPEFEALDELLKLTFRHWPEWEPDALIGDSHFDNNPTHRLCEERFGIHLIAARHDAVAESYEWAASDGTPVCSKHGEMRLVQSEGFVGVRARRKLGLAPGEPADLSKAAFRWECAGEGEGESDSDLDGGCDGDGDGGCDGDRDGDGDCDGDRDGDGDGDGDGETVPCPVLARTMWKTNPRLYTYYPRRGQHKKRMALRKALMTRRNNAESVNAALKGMGIGLGGQSVPRWVSSDRQMRWLLGGTLLGFTLRRLAHETGLYAEVHAEAEDKDLLSASVPTKQDLKELAKRLKQGRRHAATPGASGGDDSGEAMAA